MSSRFSGRLIFVMVGIFAFAITAFTVFSRAQQQSESDVLDPLEVPQEPSTNNLFTKREPHPACPTCFKVGDGRDGIYEDLPGTGRIIARELPDPAPLQPGELRPAFGDRPLLSVTAHVNE